MLYEYEEKNVQREKILNTVLNLEYLPAVWFKKAETAFNKLQTSLNGVCVENNALTSMTRLMMQSLLRELGTFQRIRRSGTDVGILLDTQENLLLCN